MMIVNEERTNTQLLVIRFDQRAATQLLPMARLLWHDRATYLEHERMELLHQQLFQHQNTIMRDERTSAGVRTITPLTLREFRLRMEARWAAMLPGFNPFDAPDDAGGCKFCDAAA